MILISIKQNVTKITNAPPGNRKTSTHPSKLTWKLDFHTQCLFLLKVITKLYEKWFQTEYQRCVLATEKKNEHAVDA